MPRTKGGPNAARERVRAASILENSPRAREHVCPGTIQPSPNQRHYWLIDADNYGKCIYCDVKGYFPTVLLDSPARDNHEEDLPPA